MTDSGARSIVAVLTELDPADRRLRLAEVTTTEQELIAMAEEVRDIVLKDLDRALVWSEVVCELADRLDLPAARARSRSMRAHVLNYANRFDDALAVLAEAGEVADEHELISERARIGLASVQTLARLGRLDEALVASRRAVDDFTSLRERELLVKALMNTGVVLRMLDDPAGAVEFLDRALKHVGDDAITGAQILSNRAEALLDAGSFAEAEAAFRQAAESLRAVGMDRAAAITEGNLADLLGRQGRLSAALSHFEIARRFFESDQAIGDLARVEVELADVLAACGMEAEAGDAYRRAIAVLDQVQLPAEAARAHRGLGQTLLQTDHAAAAESLSRAVKIFEDTGKPAQAGSTRLLLAWSAVAAGDFSRAIAEAARAEQALGENPFERLQVHRLLAEICLRRDEFDEAGRHLDDAQRHAESLDLPAIHADLHHARAQLCIARGDTADALASLRLAIASVERTRATFQGDRFRARFQGHRAQVYDDAVRLLVSTGDPGDAREAFETSELARCRSLLDIMQGGIELSEHYAAACSDDGDAKLLAQLGDERARLNSIYARLDMSSPAGDATDTWATELRACEDSIASLESRLASTRSGGDLFSKPVTLAEVQRVLSDDAALVEYTLIDGQLMAFVVDRTTLSVEDLGEYADIAELIDDFLFEVRRSLRRPDGDGGDKRLHAARAVLLELHRRLIEPIASRIDGKHRLCFVPTHALHTLPFEALYDGSRHLIESFAVSRIPSAGLLVSVAARTATPRPGSLVIGVADDAAPEIETEARTVAASLADAELLLGDRATTDALEAAVSRAGLVHLACHGVFPPKQPLAAGLRLADRWLTVRDIFGLDLKGTAVILSGCETGRVASSGADEVFGLLRGFLAAGASTLVTSLWAAHDKSSCRVMTRAYQLAHNSRDAATGLTPGLRRAQQEMIADGAHPAHWANFVVIGEPS